MWRDNPEVELGACEGRGVDAGCSWLALLLPGGTPKGPGAEQGEARRPNLITLRKTISISSSVSRTTCFMVDLVFHRL